MVRLGRARLRPRGLRRDSLRVSAGLPSRSPCSAREGGWCRRVDSNNRPSPYESAALPLSYAGHSDVRARLAPPHGFEPRSSRSRRDVLPLDEGGVERAAGFEPAPSGWKPDDLPLMLCPRYLDSVRSAFARRASADGFRGEAAKSGGECRDRTCATFRSRRVSTAMPCRSANSP